MEITEQQKQIFAGKICPYCKRQTELVAATEIYGSWANGKNISNFYICKPCEAYVGTHKKHGADGVPIALGRVAQMQLRKAKQAAHAEFDAWWQGQVYTRSELYKKLSFYLGLPAEYTHIGMFGIETCKKVLDFCEIILKEQIVLQQADLTPAEIEMLDCYKDVFQRKTSIPFKKITKTNNK